MTEEIKKRIEDMADEWKNHFPGSTPAYKRGLDEGYGLAQEEIDTLTRDKAYWQLEAIAKDAEIARLTAQNENMRALLKECLPLVRFSKEHPGDIKDEEYREKFEARHEVLKILIESILNDK